MPESVNDVLDELRSFLNDFIAAHTFATVGLRQVPGHLLGLPTVPTNPDPTVFIGAGDPNDPDVKSYPLPRNPVS